MTDLATASRVARFGKLMPRTIYVNRVVEKVVEKVVDKIVYVEIPQQGPHICARCREETRARAPEIERVIRTVAQAYGISPEDIRGPSRVPHIVRPRQIAMYLAKLLNPMRSLPQIGRMFGNRDHTTILHSVRKIERLMHEDEEFASEVETVKSTI